EPRFEHGRRCKPLRDEELHPAGSLITARKKPQMLAKPNQQGAKMKSTCASGWPSVCQTLTGVETLGYGHAP
ncbi:MAG TPA: hypothetical protein VKH44_15315, partial [Pirellulaceae bacterium]|nr:hypothetical protein [Pirellulaceae bacterium]